MTPSVGIGNFFENPSLCGILAGMTEPRFSELNKVRVNDGKIEPYEGYVIKTLFKDGRWIYKICISDDPRKTDTWDNWTPEEWLEQIK